MVFRHPAARVRWLGDMYPQTLNRLRELFLEVKAVLPFPCVDFEAVGSFARGVAGLHSDLDIIIATGTKAKREAAIQALRDNPKGLNRARAVFQRLADEYGLRIEASLEHPTAATIPVKRCYRFLEQKWYGLDNPESVRRWDWNKTTKQWQERIPRIPIRPPKMGMGYEDPETQEAVDGVDPWADIVPLWRERLNGKMIELWEEPRLAHYGIQRPPNR